MSRGVEMVNTVPRGGGWFGRGNNNGNGRKHVGNSKSETSTSASSRTSAGGGGSDGDGGDGNVPSKKSTTGRKKYPPLTQSEIEQVLHLPIYGITDSRGNGVAVRHRHSIQNTTNTPWNNGLDDDTDLVYFFFSKQMAEQARQTLLKNAKSGDNDDSSIDLNIMQIDLGKIWFRLLHNDTASVAVVHNNDNDQDDQQNQEQRKKVIFRLVPDSRNLLGAKLLTNLKPEESKELMLAIQSNQPEKALEIIQPVLTMPPSPTKPFSQPYNQIPFFYIPSMRAKTTTVVDGHVENQQPNGKANNKNADDGDDGKLPMFLGAKNMIETYMRFFLSQHHLPFQQQGNNNGMNSGLLGDIDDKGSTTATSTGIVTASDSDITSSIPNLNAQPQIQQFPHQPQCHLIDLHELVKLMQSESDFDFRNILLLPLMEENRNNGDEDDFTDTDDYDYDDNDNDNDGGGGDFGMTRNDKSSTPTTYEYEPEPQIEIYTSYADSYPQEVPRF